MDNLQAFLNPVSVDEVKEVVISKRFVDKNGKPIPFRIKTIMQEENERITRKCRKVETIRGQRVESLDNQKYNRALIVACTVEPDFRNADLCKAYGTVDPLDLPGKMLTVGEANNLAREILDLNGFSDEAEQLEDEAKN